MLQQEHWISYDGGEATQESLQDNAPHRVLGIAEMEKLRREETQKMFSSRTELAFHPLCPHPNTIIPFIPGFDPSSLLGYDVENLPMSRFQLPYSSPPVSSDGTMPLLWSSFQGDTSPSCSNSQFPFVPSALTQPRWDPQLMLPSQKHDLQQQISQVMNQSSLHSIPGGGLQLELELPSSQNCYGIMNTSSWADQQIQMHEIVGMNHPWPFQMGAAQNQRAAVPEPIIIYCSNCGAMLIDGSQGRNPDCSIDGALGLHNVGVNHNSSLFNVKRNRASEEDVAAPIDGSILSLGCLPSVCSSTCSQKTMPMRHVTKRQKTEESPVCKASATPSEALAFYNFMELPYSDYIAERDAVANKKRSWEGSDAVYVDLKL